MENRFFNQSALALLLAPDPQRIISTHCPDDRATVYDERHRAWMAQNTHTHAHREYLVILEGTCRYGYDGRTYAVTPGTVFFCDAGDMHDLKWPPWTPPMQQLWIGIIGDHIIARLHALHHGADDESVMWTAHVWPEEIGMAGDALLGGTFALEKAIPAVQRLRIHAALCAITAALIQRGYAPHVDEKTDFQQRIVHAVQRYIQETVGKDITLDSLSRFAGYSKFHLLRIFHRHSGFTIQKYIDRCRLERVHEMLQDGMKQWEIAAALGFSSPSSFSRWYKSRR